MFNAGHKKEAVADLKKAITKYQTVYKNTENSSVALYTLKTEAIDSILGAENCAGALSHLPQKAKGIVKEIVEKRLYYYDDLEIQKKNAKKIRKDFGAALSAAGIDANTSGAGRAVAGIGAAAGTGAAVLGPTAAMAIATTFGTTAGGTAIATLTGAAATNAALAWLGGGALLAGGAGMAGGSALLALLGPIGIGIGAVGLLTGGLIANKKNKEAAEKAEVDTKEYYGKIRKLSKLKKKIDVSYEELFRIHTTVKRSQVFFSRLDEKNYDKLNKDAQAQLLKFLDHTNLLATKVNEKVA
ncbi:hypothetical protein FACS189473_2270 [Spirochaetia bacterium]|nr:hypothetical protein FACS189473_2270 [Spirochaetia bacterium]